MSDLTPMTLEELNAARLRVESFRPDGSTTVMERGDVYYLGKALATIEDREARLRRAVEACKAAYDEYVCGHTQGDSTSIKLDDVLAENADLKGESP